MIHDNLFNYFGFTITFKNYLTVGERFKLIDNIPKHIICDEAEYAIEYHKKFDKTNDVLKPHVHMLLKINKKQHRCNRVLMLDYFQKEYGRSQLDCLHTPEDFTKWQDYIIKDTISNDLKYQPYVHFRRYVRTVEEKEVTLVRPPLDDNKTVVVTTTIEKYIKSGLERFISFNEIDDL